MSRSCSVSRASPWSSSSSLIGWPTTVETTCCVLDVFSPNSRASCLAILIALSTRSITNPGSGRTVFAGSFGSGLPASSFQTRKRRSRIRSLSIFRIASTSAFGRRLSARPQALYAVERSILSCRPICSKVAPRKQSSTTFRSRSRAPRLSPGNYGHRHREARSTTASLSIRRDSNLPALFTELCSSGSLR